MIKNIRNLFKPKNETKLIKDKIISDIRNVFEQEEDRKAIRIGKFCSNSYIKYGSNGGRDKNLLIGKHLNKIKKH